MQPEEQTERKDEDNIVCLGCSRIVPAAVDFCPRCGAPLSPYCTLDPFKRVLAQGQMYWRLTHGPMKGVVTLVFAFLLIAGASIGVYVLWKDLGQSTGSLGERYLQILGGVVTIVLPLALLVKVIQNYRHRKKSGLYQ